MNNPFVMGISGIVLAAILLVAVVVLLYHQRQRDTVDIDREYTVASTGEQDSIQVRTLLRNNSNSAVQPDSVLSSMPPWLHQMTEPGRIDAPLEPGEELRLTFVTTLNIGNYGEPTDHAVLEQSSLTGEPAVKPDRFA
jgi:hypothetical protein